MTLEQAQEVVDYIEDNMWDVDIELREEYSGRCMYGETVPGFVTNQPEAVAYACAMVGVDWRDVPGRIDSMGLSQIIY